MSIGNCVWNLYLAVALIKEIVIPFIKRNYLDITFSLILILCNLSAYKSGHWPYLWNQLIFYYNSRYWYQHLFFLWMLYYIYKFLVFAINDFKIAYLLEEPYLRSLTVYRWFVAAKYSMWYYKLDLIYFIRKHLFVLYCCFTLTGCFLWFYGGFSLV